MRAGKAPPVRKTEYSVADTVILTAREQTQRRQAASVQLQHGGKTLAIVGMDGDETESYVVGRRRTGGSNSTRATPTLQITVVSWGRKISISSCDPSFGSSSV